MSSNNNGNRKIKPKTQDEKQKRSNAAEKKRQKKEIDEFLLMAKRSVDFWSTAFCEGLRAFHFYALSHSEQFPMIGGDSSEQEAQDTTPEITSMPQLSSNFFERLSSRGDEDDDDKAIVDPVVQVVSCDIQFEGSGYNKDHQKTKRARLLLTDGSGRVCSGVATSQLLHAVKNKLTAGQPIIRLKLFTETTYHDQGTNGSVGRAMSGIMIMQYKFLCRPVLDVDPSTFSQLYYCKDEANEGDSNNRERGK